MSDEKIPPQFKNPCKFCIAKPACKSRCKLLHNHIETFEVTCSLSMMVICGIILLSIPIVGYIKYSKLWSVLLVLVYLMGMYTWMYRHHRENPSELNEMKPWERILIIILFPILMPFVPVWNFIENKIFTHDFYYRYNQKINPTKDF